MENHPDPVQALLLWNLAVRQGGEWMADLTSTLTAKSKRAPLVRDGLIAEEKRPRVRPGRRTVHATYVTLEEKGWAWLADHLDSPVSQSRAAADVLQRFLSTLQNHLQRNNLALADFITTDSADDDQPEHTQYAEQSPAEAAPSAMPAASDGQHVAKSRIADVYTRLAQNRSNHRVRLAELRRHLADLPREQVDGALQQMVREGIVVLNRLDNPLEISDEDEAAKLVTRLGDPRHIMHMEIHVHA